MLNEMILDKINTKKYEEYFKLFGEKRGVELYSKKSDTVNKMIEANQVRLMYYWYQKTGYKFIPDYVVMQNFPYNEIDKFLENSECWSRLMRIKEFSYLHEGREAMLKLAYLYGIFSGNTKSINHLEFLLKGIPTKISKENYKLLLTAEQRLKNAYKSKLVLPSKEEIEKYFELRKKLIDKKIIDEKSEYIFESLYKSRDNIVFNLQINWQFYSDIISELRIFMEIWGIDTVLDPFKAYRLFKNFEMKYDADLKNFLIINMNTILSNYDYITYIKDIQKKFEEIKKINCNRKLTLDLVLSFLKEDNYDNVNTGNNRLSNIVSKVGRYSQKDFEIIQKIYNYGKIRVFSSIPRVAKNIGKYSYEILKLDDPLTMVIGDITDCCQKLNDRGETCMEHSMVDTNGRVFVVRDKIGKIIAQSWVWRNGNTLCFDNIEIPNKILANAEKNGGELYRQQIATDIYNIYRDAAKELIGLDNKTYKELLNNNFITEKDYNDLKLKKVTVGLGYNDIANIIIKNAKFDEGIITRACYFEPLVKLEYPLSLKDSNKQYILEQIGNAKTYIEYPLAIYNDDYNIYTNKNITKEDIKVLEGLKLITDNTSIKFFQDNEIDKAIDIIASEYKVDVNDIKMIIHPNFAIIYIETEENNIILDMFLNTQIDNIDCQFDITNIVIIQMKLALIQILKNNKKIDIQKLPLDKLDIYNKINLELEMDNHKKLKRYL